MPLYILPDDDLEGVETCRTDVSDEWLFNIDCTVCCVKYSINLALCFSTCFYQSSEYEARDCRSLTINRPHVIWGLLLELCLIWKFMCRSVLYGMRHLDCKCSYKLLGEEVMIESIIEAVGISGWKYSYRLTERCTSLFIGLQKKCLHCTNTHRRHRAERCSKWNGRKRRISSLSMTINEFLDDDDQRVPWRWWTSSLSIITLVNKIKLFFWSHELQ